MRISVAAVGFLLAGVACAGEPAFGPQVNRDDQYRFSWYPHGANLRVTNLADGFWVK